MQCLRCLRSASAPISTFRQTLSRPIQTLPKPTLQQRPLSILSRLPTRPLAPSTTTNTHATASDTPTSSLQPVQPLGGNLLQVRGAKRDTFDPSHRVRKRRHGFLSRLRTRNGRKVLKRRRLKGRNTLSH